MTEPLDLVAFADAFVAAKRPLLDHIYPSASIAVACWLSDMLTAAQEGNAPRVHRIATRINQTLEDELFWLQYHGHKHSCEGVHHG
jgi:hypothetical protein